MWRTGRVSNTHTLQDPIRRSWLVRCIQSRQAFTGGKVSNAGFGCRGVCLRQLFAGFHMCMWGNCGHRTEQCCEDDPRTASQNPSEAGGQCTGHGWCVCVSVGCWRDCPNTWSQFSKVCVSCCKCNHIYRLCIAPTSPELICSVLWCMVRYEMVHTASPSLCLHPVLEWQPQSFPRFSITTVLCVQSWKGFGRANPEKQDAREHALPQESDEEPQWETASPATGSRSATPLASISLAGLSWWSCWSDQLLIKIIENLGRYIHWTWQEEIALVHGCGFWPGPDPCNRAYEQFQG